MHFLGIKLRHSALVMQVICVREVGHPAATKSRPRYCSISSKLLHSRRKYVEDPSNLASHISACLGAFWSLRAGSAEEFLAYYRLQYVIAKPVVCKRK